MACFVRKNRPFGVLVVCGAWCTVSPRRGRLFQGAAVEFQRTTGAMTRGEISKVHNNGKYDIIYTVDGKWLVKVNVLGTALGLLPLVP